MRDCLVVIFNHRYDDNIVKVRKLYGERFSKIIMLMPFYDGTDPDVVPVYESSFQFEGYLIQAYEKLMKVDAENYIFIADDVCLHPEGSEGKLFRWPHARDSSIPFL